MFLGLLERGNTVTFEWIAQRRTTWYVEQISITNNLYHHYKARKLYKYDRALRMLDGNMDVEQRRVVGHKGSGFFGLFCLSLNVIVVG